MWFMNHILNPLVRLILKSPAHRMMSATVLLLLYRGRKSGKEYMLPVQYVQDGEMIYILPGSPERKTWWRNLSGGAPVRLILRGQALDGQAELLRGETDEKVIAGALELYWRRFPPSARLHKVHIAADGSFPLDELQNAARSVLLVRVKLDSPN